MKQMAFVLVWFIASEGLCQTPPKETDTLQSLLVEVHQLRLDIEAMTVASQRVQIALYALQMQDVAVGRAAQRLDNARSTCKEKEERRQHFASEIQNLESTLAAGTITAVEAKSLQSRLAQSKSSLDVQTMEVQSCQGTEAEASNQLRNDQAKLAALQDRIERLDRTLGQLGVTR